MKTITLKAHAKINLALNTLEKLPSGYHKLDMLVTRISIHDLITVSKRQDEKIVLTSSSSDIPLDDKNDAYKAARLMMDYFELTHGYDIHIEKHNPISAGLGGGSTDAAAVIRAIVRLEDIACDIKTLERIALKVGTDAVLFLHDGLLRITGIGDVIEEIDASYDRAMLLVKPRFSVSTAEVYGALDIKRAQRADINALIKAIKVDDNPEVHMFNALESVTEKRHPEIMAIKKDLACLGASFAMMSGSGPSVFGVFQDKDKMEKAFEYFSDKCYDVFKISTRVDG